MKNLYCFKDAHCRIEEIDAHHGGANLLDAQRMHSVTGLKVLR